uniref:DOC domain-containing protein n=1 Tax=Aegilops tauschii subsp. strangulata TaxID=200361 RepID=A0A453A0D4_AEGTS
QSARISDAAAMPTTKIETFIHTFMLQIAVLANHLNGRDTHVRQIKIYGPRPNPVPHQPFHFTSRECIMYSTIR